MQNKTIHLYFKLLLLFFKIIVCYTNNKIYYMKNKLLLFLLIYLFLGNSLNANNSINRLNFKKYSSANLIGIVSLDTVKKKNIVAKVLKVKALIPAPLTTAGSTCKDPSLPATTAVDVFINASGGSGDLIEWFDSQTSTAILYTGSIYRAKVSKTTTFYVQTHSGSDFSIRVPVVASVYLSPSPVVLSVTPTTLPVCDGTPLTFTASGGADLFEFSIDGTIVQPMSSSRTYTTSTLTNGQTVKVRTRYAVTYDGSITETAWGTSNLEDNMLSASLSPSAIDGYINSIKISSTEDKLVFGVSGKLGPDRSMLLFLDTKPGGFNITNYGDDTVSPFVKGFNFLNSNPSNFDSYFLADYCLAVSQIGGVYVADLIELKTGNSTKVNLWGGSAGFPTDVFAVNTTNSGITDYIKGFEVGVLKSALGYSVGDIKFFGVTVRDDSAANFSISNSFLSPEITNTSDYGNGAVDFNFASPNPVVVSSDALIPCYTEDSLVINIVPLPTITGIPNVCIGLTTSLTGSGTPNATNPWVSASPSVATVDNFGIVTGVSIGTSDITYTNNNGCTITQTVTVNALPTITGTPVVCVGSTTTLTGSATPNATNPWVSATPSVATVSSLGVVTGVSAGTSVITYTNDNGCTITQTVTVNALPTITGTPNVCIGLTTTLIGSATPNSTNPWVSSAPSVATITSSGVVTGVSVGTTIITYTNSDGCETTQTFTVNALPTITGTPTVCVGLTTTLTGSATPSTTNPWVSGTPSVATVNSSGVVTGVSGGTSEITYTNSNGCTVTQTVTVNPLPTITGTPSVCVGFTTTLIGSATPNATNPWVSASPSVATVNSSGVVTGVSGGTSVITYTNSNGCTVDQIFTVYATPTISGTPNVCIGLTTALTGSGAPNATNPWVSASPSVATITSSGVVTGVSAGTSVIRYTDNNGCTITQTVTVNALPTITGNPIVCVGSTTTLTGSATPNATNPWVSATPSVATISSSGVVTGVSAGTSLITYTNSNGCTITQTVTVNALPTITGSPNVCIGLTTTLIGSATPNATNPWVSSTPSIATITSSGVVTGVSVGTTIITYTNTNGCVINQTFTVNALPVATLSSNDSDNTFCSGTSVTFTASGGVSYNFRVNNLSVQSGSSAIYITSSLTNGQTVDVVVSNAAGCTSISSLITNTVLLTPVQPTLNIIAQPNCISSSGSFKISNYNASFTYTISPSAGVVRSADMVTAPSGNYLVTAISGVCSSSASITVNAIPPQIQFESSGDCVDKNYILTATPLNNSYDSNTVNYEWKDNLGNVVGTNSNVLNATDAVRSMTGTVSYPLTFTLKVSSDLTKCSTVNSVTIESVFCNIQKGISPDGNGSNDYFDLKLLDVKKLEIFDRYGIKVYNRVNYTDQWKGQSDNGNELPSATYYYVIEFNNGMTKTGWIYLIREK